MISSIDRCVANSVFECDVTEAQYTKLKEELRLVIDEEVDNIRFYHLNKNKNHCIETLGIITTYDINDTIIL